MTTCVEQKTAAQRHAAQPVPTGGLALSVGFVVLLALVASAVSITSSHADPPVFEQTAQQRTIGAGVQRTSQEPAQTSRRGGAIGRRTDGGASWSAVSGG